MLHPVVRNVRSLSPIERDRFTDTLAAHRAAFADFMRDQRTVSARTLAAIAWH